MKERKDGEDKFSGADELDKVRKGKAEPITWGAKQVFPVEAGVGHKIGFGGVVVENKAAKVGSTGE